MIELDRGNFDEGSFDAGVKAGVDWMLEMLRTYWKEDGYPSNRKVHVLIHDFENFLLLPGTHRTGALNKAKRKHDTA